VCHRTIPGGEGRLELETEAQWIKAKVSGAVCRRCIADSVLAAIGRRLDRDAQKDAAKLAHALGVEPAHFARAMRHLEKTERRRQEFQ
jgi:hypothetical protein